MTGVLFPVPLAQQIAQPDRLIMADWVRDRLGFGRQSGEIGWVACISGHCGKGLGMTVSVVATARLIEEGYRVTTQPPSAWD